MSAERGRRAHCCTQRARTHSHTCSAHTRMQPSAPARNQRAARNAHAARVCSQAAAHGHEPLSSTSGLAGLLPSAFHMLVKGCSGSKSRRAKVHIARAHLFSSDPNPLCDPGKGLYHTRVHEQVQKFLSALQCKLLRSFHTLGNLEFLNSTLGVAYCRRFYFD